MKRIVLFFMLFVSLFLASCGDKKEESKTQQIKISNLELTIPAGFVSTLSGDKKLWQFKIIEEYKNPSFSGFSSSLIVWEYFWTYPSDFDKFFSVVEDKFLRKIPGSNLLKQWKFSIKWWVKISYFEYSVKNKLFEDSKPDYYWIQAYILDNKKVYVINYLSSNKDDISDILDSLKDMRLIN